MTVLETKVANTETGTFFDGGVDRRAGFGRRQLPRGGECAAASAELETTVSGNIIADATASLATDIEANAAAFDRAASNAFYSNRGSDYEYSLRSRFLRRGFRRRRRRDRGGSRGRSRFFAGNVRRSRTRRDGSRPPSRTRFPSSTALPFCNGTSSRTTTP